MAAKYRTEATVLCMDPRNNGFDEQYSSRGPIFRFGGAMPPLSEDFFRHLQGEGVGVLRLVKHNGCETDRRIYRSIMQLPPGNANVHIKDEELRGKVGLINGFKFEDFERFSAVLRREEARKIEEMAKEFGIRVESECLRINMAQREGGMLIITDMTDKSSSQLAEEAGSNRADYCFIIQAPVHFLRSQKKSIEFAEMMSDVRVVLPGSKAAGEAIHDLLREKKSK